MLHEIQCIINRDVNHDTFKGSSHTMEVTTTKISAELETFIDLTRHLLNST